MADFEDILDGYFPLRISVADLMVRRGLQAARLQLSFAPIIEVPNLPPEAPVPLTIRGERAGMIREAVLFAALNGAKAALSGRARWRWYDDAPDAAFFDPMTRLAEPALVLVTPGITDEACSGAILRV